MKKIYTTLMMVLGLVLATQAQNWIVYEADDLPDAATPAFSSSNVSGIAATNVISDDPLNLGNSLLELISAGAESRFMWKQELENSSDDSLTFVIRMKGLSDTLDRVMEIDLQQAGFRERLYIYSNNTYKLQEAGVTGDLPGNVMDWHIYRLTKVADSVSFYFDEAISPLDIVFTSTATEENYFRFGDGNGSSTLGATIDWVIWDTTGAYTPLEGDALPDPLVTLVPGWKVYTASALPLDSDPAFVASNTTGSDETNTTNTIIDDPDIMGNKILEEITNISDARYMYRYTFPENPTSDLTLVGRIRGISNEYSRVMELDLDHGGFRERLYINTDSTFKLQESGLTDTLDAGLMGWHIYRVTKTGDSVNFYFDENPEPMATVKTPTISATNNYFRFGDGNSSITLGAYVDWFIWDESGAYAPGRGAFIPDSLAVMVSSADLTSLSLSAGSLDPLFHADSLQYDVILPEGTEAVTITAVSADSSATIEGAGEVDLSSGEETAEVVVTASDGTTIKTYTIHFTVIQPLSDDATLSALTVSAGTLEPQFDAATMEYTLTLPAESTSVTITPVTTHPNASVTGGGEITTLPGSVTLTVTAENGTTVKTYTVTVELQTALNDPPDIEELIYPNPFGNKLVVNSTASIREVSICDIYGKTILQNSVNGTRVELPTAGLKSGVYFIKLVTEEGTVIRKAVRN